MPTPTNQQTCSLLDSTRSVHPGAWLALAALAIGLFHLAYTGDLGWMMGGFPFLRRMRNRRTVPTPV